VSVQDLTPDHAGPRDPGPRGQSIASWLGLARHARAFRLSRSLFLAHDVRHIGKRLLLRMVSGETELGRRRASYWLGAVISRAWAEGDRKNEKIQRIR